MLFEQGSQSCKYQLTYNYSPVIIVNIWCIDIPLIKISKTTPRTISHTLKKTATWQMILQNNQIPRVRLIFSKINKPLRSGYAAGTVLK